MSINCISASRHELAKKFFYILTVYHPPLAPIVFYKLFFSISDLHGYTHGFKTHFETSLKVVQYIHCMLQEMKHLWHSINQISIFFFKVLISFTMFKLDENSYYAFMDILKSSSFSWRRPDIFLEKTFGFLFSFISVTIVTALLLVE